MHHRRPLRAAACLASIFLLVALLAPSSRAGGAPPTPVQVRPFTPLRAALEQIARDRGLPLTEVLADPARWLTRNGDDPRPPVGGNTTPDHRPPAVAATVPGLPIRFAVPQLLGEQLRAPYVGDVDGNGIVGLAAQSTDGATVTLFEGDALHPLVDTHSTMLEAGDVLSALSDVDRDGRADLIAARATDGSVAIYRSLGAWNFAAPVRHLVGFTPRLVLAGDVSGDGWPELIAVSDSVRTLVNAGDGSFTLAGAVIITGFMGPAAVADLDGDGRADVALRTFADDWPNPPAIQLLHGEPGGGLTVWTRIPTPGDNLVVDIVAGDLDGNGHTDLLSGGNDSLRAYFGEGAGAFRSAVVFDVTPFYLNASLELADFDRDGRLDVAVARRTRGCFSGCQGVSVLLGTGAGALAPPIDVLADDPNAAWYADPLNLSRGDFDADGAPDLVARFGSGAIPRMSLLLNDGDGGFLAPVINHVPFEPFGPYGVSAARLVPSRPETVLLWDGTRTWIADNTGPNGFRHLTLFSTGEVVSTADLDSDSLDDILLASGDTTIVFVSAGGGTFMPPVSYVGYDYLACADFDGAGGPDLAIADADHHVLVRVNDGTGRFGPPVDWGVVLASDVSSVSGADLDRDGRAELLVGHDLPGLRDTVAVHWNGGTAFGAGNSLACGMLFESGPVLHNATHPSTMAAGDFDGNGWPDLYVVHAVASDNPGSISILLNMGGHAFLPAVDYATSRDPWMGVVADFDRDGLDDVAVVCDQDNWNGSVLVFHAGFGGVLTRMDQCTAWGVPAQHYPTSIALGDWNMDGRRDLVVGNVQGRTVGFYRNVSPPPLPTTTEVSLSAAEARPDGVHLEWFVSASSFVATLERASAPDAWQALGRVSADGAGRIAWIDTDVVAGARVGYRLAWNEGGATRHAGETWLDVPRTDGPQLAMAGARPNPARGAAVLVFTLPRTGDATLEVFDVSGRVVLREDLRGAAAGQHARAVGRERALAPGLYLARLTQGAQRSTARFVMTE